MIGFIVWYAGHIIEKYLHDARSLASQRGAILESITDGVLVFDLSGKVIAKNSAACIMLGWVVNSIEEIAAAAKESDAMETLLFLASGDKSSGNIDWNERPLILTGSPVTSPAGERIGVAVTIHDFTPQTQVERAKDTILALSSHEMRTPLAIMMGYAQMLQKTVGQNQDDNLRNGLASIVSNAKRLDNTLSSMSTLAELQAGRLSIEKKTIKSSDLLLVLEPFKQHAREKGLEFRVVRDLPDKFLITDPVRIKQVLDNLVGNAIKFTESGGVIVHFYERDGCWGVQITDTGPGVEKDRMPALFEAFSLAGNDYATRSFQGIGLGLTVTKHLVEMMGGEITVQSQVGIGSTFEIEFPLGGDQHEQ